MSYVFTQRVPKKRNSIVSGLEKTPVNRMRFEPIFEQLEEFQAINIKYLAVKFCHQIDC